MKMRISDYEYGINELYQSIVLLVIAHDDEDKEKLLTSIIVIAEDLLRNLK